MTRWQGPHIVMINLNQLQKPIMDEQAQERSHDILDTLELVTNEMAVAVTRCSADFRYLWANQAYADWLQRPLNENRWTPDSKCAGGRRI